MPRRGARPPAPTPAARPRTPRPALRGRANRTRTANTRCPLPGTGVGAPREVRDVHIVVVARQPTARGEDIDPPRAAVVAQNLPDGDGKPRLLSVTAHPPS